MIRRHLAAAATRLGFWLGPGRCRKKLLLAVGAAKVKRFSVAVSVERTCSVHGHAADGVFGGVCRLRRGHIVFNFHVTVVRVRGFAANIRPTLAARRVAVNSISNGKEAPCASSTQCHQNMAAQKMPMASANHTASPPQPQEW